MSHFFLLLFVSFLFLLCILFYFCNFLKYIYIPRMNFYWSILLNVTQKCDKFVLVFIGWRASTYTHTHTHIHTQFWNEIVLFTIIWSKMRQRTQYRPSKHSPGVQSNIFLHFHSKFIQHSDKAQVHWHSHTFIYLYIFFTTVGCLPI